MRLWVCIKFNSKFNPTTSSGLTLSKVERVKVQSEKSNLNAKNLGRMAKYGSNRGGNFYSRTCT